MVRRRSGWFPGSVTSVAATTTTVPGLGGDGVRRRGGGVHRPHAEAAGHALAAGRKRSRVNHPWTYRNSWQRRSRYTGSRAAAPRRGVQRSHSSSSQTNRVGLSGPARRTSVQHNRWLERQYDRRQETVGDRLRVAKKRGVR